MNVADEVLGQLEPEQQSKLLAQLRRLNVNDDDPLFAVLAAIGYHRLLIEQIPQQIDATSQQAQERIEAAINAATTHASYEASEAAKRDFAEFAKKAIALAVEKSQNHSEATQQAKIAGYRWLAGTAIVSLLVGAFLGWGIGSVLGQESSESSRNTQLVSTQNSSEGTRAKGQRATSSRPRTPPENR